MSVYQSPDVKLFHSHPSGEIRGKATIPHHGEGAREDIRDFRQTLRARPLPNTRIVPDLRNNPVPIHIVVINSKRGRKNRPSYLGKRRTSGGAQEERQVRQKVPKMVFVKSAHSKVPKKKVRYFSESDRATLAESGRWKNED